MNQPIKKIKVKPYPIRAAILGGPKPVEVEILKLVRAGFLANVKEMFHVGHHFETVFQLPVSHYEIRGPVRVRKTYDRLVPGTATRERIVEFSFEARTDEQTQHISQFLRTIRQEEF